MTIKEIKEMYKGQYEDIEVYKVSSSNSVGKHYPSNFHTDNCEQVEEFTDESEVGLYELMDENEYNHSIMANSDIYADFEDWYGNKDTKILCIMLKN